MWTRDYKPSGDTHNEVNMTPLIDVSLLTDDILDLYTAHRRALRFAPADVLAGFRNDSKSFEQSARAMPDEFDLQRRYDEAIGSNNWVLSGPRTLTRKPLLANDPHLALRIQVGSVG